jgi:hypothetical protein
MSVKLAGDGQEAVAHAQIPIELPCEEATAAYLGAAASHVRTVASPQWAKASLDGWTTAAGLTHGRAFRAINKAGRVWREGMTPKGEGGG